MTTFSGKLSWVKSESFIRILQFLAGIVAIGIIFYLLQFSTTAICCGDFDGYYHVQWARELWMSMKSKVFPPAFPWLPLTTLNPKDYVDHHLLFHIFQIPFVAASDPRLGAKIAAALCGSLVVTPTANPLAFEAREKRTRRRTVSISTRSFRVAPMEW